MFDFEETEQNKRNEQAKKRAEDNRLAAKIRSNIDALQHGARLYFSEKQIDVAIDVSETQVQFSREGYGTIVLTGLYNDNFTVHKEGTKQSASIYQATSQVQLNEAEVTRLIVDWVDGEV